MCVTDKNDIQVITTTEELCVLIIIFLVAYRAFLIKEPTFIIRPSSKLPHIKESNNIILE